MGCNMQRMDKATSLAAFDLLRQLAVAGVEEAAAFVQQQEQHEAATTALWRAGGRRMLKEANLSSGQTAVYIVICILLVIFAGCMAGLTLGLLSLDKVDLEVVKRSGTDKQKWLVTQVEPVGAAVCLVWFSAGPFSMTYAGKPCLVERAMA
jgi:hypothetical protein